MVSILMMKLGKETGRTAVALPSVHARQGGFRLDAHGGRSIDGGGPDHGEGDLQQKPTTKCVIDRLHSSSSALES